MGNKPLVSVTLVFLSGLLASEVFSFFPLTLTVFVFILLLVEAVFFRSGFFPVSLLVVWTVGFVLHQNTLKPPDTHDLGRYVDQGPVRVIARISEPVQYTKKYASLKMKAVSIGAANASGQMPFHAADGVFRLYISSTSNEVIPFEYGDELALVLRLRHPKQYQNPGSFLSADYRERVGWAGVASLSHFDQAKKVGEGGNPILKRVYRWREEIRKKILASVDEPAASILLAMVIGESGNLSDEVREGFASAGIAHLLSVSGSHLVFVSVFVFALCRGLMLRLPEPILLRCTAWKIPSQWAALCTAFAVTFYAFLAGGQIATLRALAMTLVYLLSIWLCRSRDTQISLSLAALLIVLFQPQAIFEISFQLSFTAVLSIVLFVEWWRETKPDTAVTGLSETPQGVFQKYVLDPSRLLLLSSVGAAIGTAPLSLFYFHQFSWVGVAVNLLLVPVAGVLLIPFALCAALVSLFTETFPLPFLHERLWSAFYHSTQWFAGAPGADLRFASPALSLVVLFYALFFFMLVTRRSRKSVFGVSTSFFLIFLGWGAFRIPPETLRVTFLDVGQGDAALIEFPNGQTLLIDGGDSRAGKYAVAPYLWQRRIREIDYLIGTHPQSDHIGGLPFILQNFKVNTVWTNGMPTETETYGAFETAIRETGAVHQIAFRGASLKIDICRLVFLNPGLNPDERPISSRGGLNNHSIVFSLSCSVDGRAPLTFLFTGDIEQETEAVLLTNAATLKNTVLKVPHHGSRSSSGERFIAAVSPKIVIFSAGRKNRYRHPHQEVTQRYALMGATPYRTDYMGAIFIEADGDPAVTTYGERRQERIRRTDSVFNQEWRNIQKAFYGLDF